MIKRVHEYAVGLGGAQSLRHSSHSFTGGYVDSTDTARADHADCAVVDVLVVRSARRRTLCFHVGVHGTVQP